ERPAALVSSSLTPPAIQVARAVPLQLRGKGIEAKGYEVDEGFVVLAGSQAAKDEVPSIHQHVASLRQQLISRDVLKPDGDRYVFSQDYTFSSPSNAAGVVLARSANGRIEWKDANGRTLKDLQAGIGDTTREG